MKIYVGIPMYGGAHALTVRSLLSLQSHLMAQGHAVVFDIVTGGSILPKVRNGIVKRFIGGDADVLLFVDSDMCFEPQTIEKLINAPFDVSVANYRKRHNDMQYMAEAGNIGEIFKGNMWWKTFRAGTGLMAIKRGIIQTMIDNLPELHYFDNGQKIPCLFDFQLIANQYHGEDYTFCDRLTAIGGLIYILADCFVGHIGDTVYAGNYSEHIRG